MDQKDTQHIIVEKPPSKRGRKPACPYPEGSPEWLEFQRSRKATYMRTYLNKEPERRAEHNARQRECAARRWAKYKQYAAAIAAEEPHPTPTPGE